MYGIAVFIRQSLNIIQIEKRVLLICKSMNIIIKVVDIPSSSIFVNLHHKYRSPNDNLDNYINVLVLFL